MTFYIISYFSFLLKHTIIFLNLFILQYNILLIVLTRFLFNVINNNLNNSTIHISHERLHM